MRQTARSPLPLALASLALVSLAACASLHETDATTAGPAPAFHPLPPPRAAVPRLPPALASAPPAAALAALTTARERPRRTIVETGVASWYGPGFAGRPTASGEIFDPQAMTAAHPALPLGAEVIVVNLENGREARLRINDRGPFIGERVIDVSKAAAKALGFYLNGLAEVRVDLVTPPVDDSA